MGLKDIEIESLEDARNKAKPGCLGYYDAWTGEFDCEYETTLLCEECKYCCAGGRKDPEAKCNQIKET
jgi:hypothetical protein